MMTGGGREKKHNTKAKAIARQGYKKILTSLPGPRMHCAV
jgi:hypothetical protein